MKQLPSDDIIGFNSIRFLSETALEFSSSDINHRIFDYIGECLTKLNPGAIILINSINYEDELLRTEVAILPESKIKTLFSLLGYNLKGKTYRFDESILELQTGYITKFRYGIHEMSFGTIPKIVAKQIEKLFNLGGIYGIGFLVDGKMYAMASMLLPKGLDLLSRETIEIFARQASVNLKRVIAEQKEEEFHSLFDHMMEGAFYLNADGDIMEINDAALRIFGVSRYEFLNKGLKNSIFRLINETSDRIPAKETAPYIALSSGKMIKDQIVGIFNPELHEYVWVKINAIPRFLAGATTPHRIFVTVHDITESKSVLEKLQKAENDSRTLIEAIPDLMFKINKDYIFVQYKADQGSLYYREGDFTGKSCREIFPLEFAEFVESKVDATLSSDEIQQFEYQLDIPDLGKNDFEARMVPSGEGGVVAIVRNITERKRNDRLLMESEVNARAVLESSQSVIILIDKYLNIIDTNTTYAQQYGVSRQELIGLPVADLISPTLHHRIDHVKQVFASGEPLSNEDFKDDHWFFYRIIPMKNANGIVEQVTVFADDITERKKIEINLHELNTTKDKLFSILAHDLKNPFNTILGFSDILMKDAAEAEISDIISYAGVIKKAAGQTLTLLDNLLNWATIQKGGMKFEPKPLVLKELCRTVINQAAESAKIKNITIHNHVPDLMIITADAEMILLVLRNLVSNAIKFSYPGNSISIQASEIDRNAEITVSDTGTGITPENIAKLFDIGSGFSTRGTGNEGGTGIGLGLCREFVEKHGGTIRVESEPGKGSNFTFTIPARVL